MLLKKEPFTADSIRDITYSSSKKKVRSTIKRLKKEIRAAAEKHDPERGWYYFTTLLDINSEDFKSVVRYFENVGFRVVTKEHGSDRNDLFQKHDIRIEWRR